MKKTFLLILCFLPAPLFSNLQLDLNPDALSTSLNGAGDTIIRNSCAVYNNPANLVFLFRPEAVVSYMYFIDDIQRAALTYAWKTRGQTPFCLDISYLNYGTVPRFTLGANEYSVQQGEGLNIWFLDAGISSGTRISFRDDNILLGGRVSFLLNHLDYSYTGILFDAGLAYYPDYRGFAFSVSLRDLGFLNSFADTASLKLNLGLGYCLAGIETELNCHLEEKWMLHWGNRIEIFRKMFFLTGIKFDKQNILQNNLNLGVELDLTRLNLYYAIVPKAVVGAYHYFSIRREF
ncbi:MAG: hypothetical protein PHF84_01035 [bacterium]|nr:hypothetical protein [bacterium]